MPILPQSASAYTETVKSAAQANGSIAVAMSGKFVRSSSSSGSVRPAGALGAIVKASAVARSSGLAPPKPPSGPVVATVSAHTSSKTIVSVSSVSYDLYTFTNVGNGSFVVSDAPLTADIFVLGGGGSGSYSGGGAGGLGVYSNVSIPQGSYVITVGNGGTGVESDVSVGNNGQDSKITISGKMYKGIGGGAGGMYNGAGTNGGCGGGGMRILGTQGSALQTASDGGFNGYNGGWHDYGAGGGGMGGVGLGDPQYAGGPGVSTNFTGTIVFYGGGGGGSGNNGPGGTGGGGRGKTMMGPGGDGTAGLGGGGGGQAEGYHKAGAGGSGLVMIRIKR